MELSTISANDMQELTGRKMDWAEKFAFNQGQKKLRKNIAADGTINSKKLNKMAAPMAAGGGFHFGGFVLGFLLSLLGVLIAYLIKDEKKASRVKWAWIGFALIMVIYLVVVLV